MKKIYQSPLMEVEEVIVESHILESSFGGVGGSTGEFDAPKQHEELK